MRSESGSKKWVSLLKQIIGKCEEIRTFFNCLFCRTIYLVEEVKNIHWWCFFFTQTSSLEMQEHTIATEFVVIDLYLGNCFYICILNFSDSTFSLMTPTDETAKRCCTFTVVVAEQQQRQHWGRGRGTEKDKEKQHLLGNNYLSHPPAAACGRSSRDGCQFAARLSLNQRLCFSLCERSCWQSFLLFTATFSPTLSFPELHGKYVWQFTTGNMRESLVIDTGGTAQKHSLPHLSTTSTECLIWSKGVKATSWRYTSAMQLKGTKSKSV